MSGYLAPATPYVSLRGPARNLAPVHIDYYRRASAALMAARSIDDVAEISDRASALREYARRAKNRDLEIDAVEIRWRAERRLGEMLASAGNQPPGRPTKGNRRIRLADLKISHRLSASAKSLGSIPAPQFEGAIKSFRDAAPNLRRLPSLFPHPSPAPRNARPSPQGRATISALARAELNNHGDATRAADALVSRLAEDLALLREVVESAIRGLR